MINNLLYAVQTLPVEVIDHKFLVPGHTMMKCDSMHSAIESAHKHVAVYSMHEWVNVLKSARRHNPYSVKVIHYSEFYDLKHLAREARAYYCFYFSVIQSKYSQVRCFGPR